MGKEYDAIKQGAKEAILEVLSQASDLPGEDTFTEIKTGVREATLEWLNNHSNELTLAIAKEIVAAIKADNSA